MSKESFLKQNLLLVRAVEMTTKDLEWHIHLVDEAVVGLRGLIPNLKKSSTVDKMLSISLTCYSEIICERKSQSVWQTSLPYFKKLSQPPPP